MGLHDQPQATGGADPDERRRDEEHDPWDWQDAPPDAGQPVAGPGAEPPQDWEGFQTSYTSPVEGGAGGPDDVWFHGGPVRAPEGTPSLGTIFDNPGWSDFISGMQAGGEDDEDEPPTGGGHPPGVPGEEGEGEGGDGPPGTEMDSYWDDFIRDFNDSWDFTPPTVSAGEARTPNAEVDAFQRYLMGQARQHMENPSRYDADLVRQGMDVINAEIEEMRRVGGQSIAAQMAQRGLSGSGLEAGQTRMMEADLDRTANQRAFQLAQDQARTWAQDRSSAFQMGLGTSAQAAQRDSDLMQQDRANRALELQAQGMNQDAAFRQADLEMRRAFGSAGLGLQGEAMRLENAWRGAEFDRDDQRYQDESDRWEREFERRNLVQDRDFSQRQLRDMIDFATWLSSDENFAGFDDDFILDLVFSAFGDHLPEDWREQQGRAGGPGTLGSAIENWDEDDDFITAGYWG